ncbi:MAG TPA: ribosome silencing factor [Alphaproteobacteria bacterium]|nr:ribosome silencing factor [Alphaproteobacteria bacterium]
MSVETPAALKAYIESALDADKAIDIETIDLRGQTSIADYMIIASGRSSTQIVSTAHKLADRLKALGVTDIHVEGTTQGDWVVLDAGDVIVHLFRPEIRVFYDLARMWRPQFPGTPVRVGTGASSPVRG